MTVMTQYEKTMSVYVSALTKWITAIARLLSDVINMRMYASRTALFSGSSSI